MKTALTYLDKYLSVQFLKTISLDEQSRIMERGLGRKVTFSALVTSPFREDINPGCSFFTRSDNVLVFKDWAKDESYTCLDIMKLTIPNFDIKNININNYKLVENKKEKIKSNKKIEILPSNFSIEELKFFYKRGIGIETLNKFEVISAKYVYVNNVIRHKQTINNYIFVYTMYPTGCKVYRPNAEKTDKHKNYCSSNSVFGLKQLRKRGKWLIITKSPKDVMALHELGFNSICAGAESALLTKEVMTIISKRFDKIFTLMDNDKTGIAISNKFAKLYNTYPLFFSKELEKDTSDNVLKYGRKKTKKYIFNLINKM